MNWTVVVPYSGTCSSPRAIDLNEDGVKDIVIGAGGNEEWESSENGVLAIDGASGQILWKAPCRNQMVGSATFLAIDNDKIPDVIIGGRSAQLLAVSGKTGHILWEYQPHDPAFDYRNDTALLNFFTPQLVADLDGDEKEDLLVTYGGFVAAPPFDPERPTGYLMLISSKDGRLLHRAAVPDGKETYCSPVVIPDAGDPKILFGAGGETIPGNLYLTPLRDLFDNRINEHRLLAIGKEKGFIAPPVLADITGDGLLDIIVNAYEGTTLAIDGGHYTPIWKFEAGPDFETHTQPAVALLTDDEIPDFFVHFSRGQWPDSRDARQYLIDGRTGRSFPVDSLGSLQMSSPVAVTTSDRDKVLLALNQRIATGYAIESGRPQEKYRSKVVLFDLKEHSRTTLKEREGINLGSTPLVDDLDGDGQLEMIYCFNRNPYDIQRFGGFQIECTTLPGAVGQLHPWNQYLGAGLNSVYSPAAQQNNYK